MNLQNCKIVNRQLVSILPGETGQGLDGLEGEGPDLVGGEAEGVDGGGKTVRGNISDVIAVQV